MEKSGSTLVINETTMYAKTATTEVETDICIPLRGKSTGSFLHELPGRIVFFECGQNVRPENIYGENTRCGKH